MKEKIKQLGNSKFTVPILLLVLIVIAYGLLTPWMGFYWDDLPFAWISRFLGPTEFIEAFRPFRPLLGYIFTITTSLFGEHPITWQILGLITRLFLGLEVWILLKQVWPRQKHLVLFTTLLFTLYPAYQQQAIAFTHINQEWIPFLFLLASFILTTWAVRHDRSTIWLIVLSIVFQILGLFSTEYFFGLEILRFLFVLAVLSETIRNRNTLLKKAAWIWLPYFIVWVANAIWTYSYHRSTAYNSYDINAFSALAPINIINEFLNTLTVSGFTSWINPFNLFKVVDGSATQIISIFILSLVAILVFLVTQIVGDVDDIKDDTSHQFGWWAISIGLVGIFAGRLPSWAAGLPLKIDFDYDRLFISIMLGASLFIVGLADILLRNGRVKLVLLSVFIGVSAASQFSTTNTFRRDWANEQDLFWQMAWRMPALKDGTAILAYDLPLKYASDLQLTAPLNWMYTPDFKGHDLSYAILYLKTRFTPSNLKVNQPITLPYRTASFTGNTSNVVVIFKEADGCLRVLDPIYNNVETVPVENNYLAPAILLSRPDLILVDADLPSMDRTMFGDEPAYGWCYIYTQAEIYRQVGDWAEIAKLYKTSKKSGLYPTLPVEYFPFIEALALTGDSDKALEITSQIIKEQKTLCPALFTLWERVLKTQQDILLDPDSVLQKACQSG
ncbi:MAG: hypothetical protein IPP66_10060 [Anaerolineales bacterium]|nr:hypothetical protein [Anaerolineales bacterium]